MILSIIPFNFSHLPPSIPFSALFEETLNVPHVFILGRGVLRANFRLYTVRVMAECGLPEVCRKKNVYCT
jgi:hypothetical protein